LSASDGGQRELGISKECLSKIHDPFLTTKEQVKGTCLGLGIVRQLVVKDGGKLSVSSHRSKGGDVFAKFFRKSVSKYSFWAWLNGPIKAIASRPLAERGLVDG
jgi:signal transduction histidine kinase